MNALFIMLSRWNIFTLFMSYLWKAFHFPWVEKRFKIKVFNWTELNRYSWLYALFLLLRVSQQLWRFTFSLAENHCIMQKRDVQMQSTSFQAPQKESTNVADCEKRKNNKYRELMSLEAEASLIAVCFHLLLSTTR